MKPSLYQRPFFYASFLAFIVAILCSAWSTAVLAGDDGLIHVSASGTATAKPDQAELRLTFSAEHLDVNEAREMVDERVAPFLRSLKRFTLENNSLDSSQTQIHPQYDYNDGQQQLKAYRVTRSIRFILNDLTELQDVVETITQSKASRLDNIQFKLTDPEALHRQALSNAIARSRQIATDLADGYGVKLGGIHSVRHNATGQPPSPQPRMMAMEMARAEKVPTYHQQDLDMTVQVDVAYRID